MSGILHRVERRPGQDYTDYTFWCAACKCGHWFRVGDAPVQAKWWTFNGNTEKPTVTPSIRVTSHPITCCHLFITDGQIQYLADCTHELAGKTVPMEPF